MSSRLAILIVVMALPLLVPALQPATAHAGHDERPHVPESGVWFQEVVTDPQSDRTGGGGVTSIDEYVVVYNAGPDPVDVTGWALTMNDTTPEDEALAGILGPGERMTLHNPPGQMNNDVELVLTDTEGTVQDQVRLGEAGVPDGNADDVFDEAVYLSGLWAASRAPASNGTGLESFWVESMARAGTVPAAPFAPAWTMAGDTRLDLRLHAAPGPALHNVSVTIGDEAVTATHQGGNVWRTEPVAVDADVFVQVHVNGSTVSEYPGREALILRVDATAPTIPDGPAVTNGTRHVRWLPLPFDQESGIIEWSATAVNATHEWPLTGCQPHDDPASTCRVPTDNVTVRISAENAAGGVTNASFVVHNDTAAPAPPAQDWFGVGTPPTWHWASFGEPLKRLQVEVADDVTGVWVRGLYDIDPGATTFQDDDWTPGDPRAYRLIARDRADHVTHTEWVALPPEAVPVQWGLAGDAHVLADTLVAEGTVAVPVSFDRALDVPPSLVLVANEPRPARLVVTGALAPEGNVVHYVVEAPASFPGTGTGIWSLEGGRGIDDAPMSATAVPAAWDTEAPRLDATGVSDVWIRAKRHVVTLHAVDAGDPEAVVDLDRTGKGMLVRKDGTGRQVTFTKEGSYEVTGSVRDGAGNARAFVVRAALDGTPPSVALDQSLPALWSGDDAIELRVGDEVSGVNRSTLQAWVQSANASTVATVAGWEDGVVRLAPGEAWVARPLRVHIAVADVAGNLAEGVVVHEAVPLRPRSTDEDPVVLGNTSGGAAPQPSGPGWLVPGVSSGAPGTDDTGGAAGDEASGAGVHAERTDRAAGPSDAGGKTLDWVMLGIVGAGGSIGLGTVVRRSRQRATDRRSSYPGQE